MKLDRLLAIITVLLQREHITAPELANRLEVSKRTIHRDIDTICQAGIPVITRQGGNGGISIADGFKLDKSLLTTDELQSILIGLKGLDSISGTSRIGKLIHKLSPQSEAAISMKEPVLIDLSSHYKGSLSEKIDLIKSAIHQSRLIRFTYYSEKGKNERSAEPILITFQWTSWYLYCYCLEKQDFRLFKLNRLWGLSMLDESFKRRDIPHDTLDFEQHFTDDHEMTLILDKDMEYQVVDEYGPQAYTNMEDGRIMLKVRYTNRERMLFWIMGLGDKVRVVDPPDLVMEVHKRAKNLLSLYEQDI